MSKPGHESRSFRKSRQHYTTEMSFPVRSSSYDDLLRRGGQQQPGLMMTDRSSSPGGRGEFHETCFHPQSRICSNLRYNLHQMRVRSQRDPYTTLVEAVAVGPETVTNVEAERILGIDKQVFQKSRASRRNVSVCIAA